tara:strand:+ start:7295 stop:7567 length:273 start_codon:yes stop_codon:yes gene_type:complete
MKNNRQQNSDQLATAVRMITKTYFGQGQAKLRAQLAGELKSLCAIESEFASVAHSEALEAGDLELAAQEDRACCYYAKRAYEYSLDAEVS